MAVGIKAICIVKQVCYRVRADAIPTEKQNFERFALAINQFPILNGSAA